MTTTQLGLKENWKQFSLLVLVNAFVGGMIGLERSIFPQLAQEEFHIAGKTAIFSFIIAFGITKAITNYFTGALANKYGRKNLLVTGWLIAIPIPFILIYADSWNLVILANVLLGLNQGLTWSSTVVMKIDLVGEKNRGLAMGINEFAGYFAVAVTGLATGWIASTYGIRPYPFYLGIGISIVGLLLSIFFVKDTGNHSKMESTISKIPKLTHIFWETTWKHKILGSVNQAGLVNNLNDAMAWGILPILLATKGYQLRDIGIITAVYPAIWGIGQLFTGKMADHFPARGMLFWGMLMQGLALLGIIFADSFAEYILITASLGAGTALVYPTFLSTIAANTNPEDRAKSLGVFRFWRDSGYAIGALITGVLADTLGINSSIIFIGALTILSAIIIGVRMWDKNNKISKS